MLRMRFTIFIFILGLLLPLFSLKAEIILSSHKYAWSNNVGYINFENVIVSDNTLSGYAWSENKGFINFNPTKGGVLNDGTGNLSGYAWGEQLGWINFGNVNIDDNGKFSGTAEGNLVGIITFDCPNYCDVETDWRPITTSTSNVSSSGSIVSRYILPPINYLVPGLPSTGSMIPRLIATKVSYLPKKTTDLTKTTTKNPALFDIISEPVPQTQKNVTPSIIFLIIGEILFILLMIKIYKIIHRPKNISN